MRWANSISTFFRRRKPQRSRVLRAIDTGCFEPVDRIVISLKMEVPRAQLLVTRRGLEVACKRAANEKSNARRARSRQRFKFRAAIAVAIEARFTRRPCSSMNARLPRVIFNPLSSDAIVDLSSCSLLSAWLAP